MAQQKFKRILVIGMDGLSAHGIKRNPTPNFDSMMLNGAFTLKAEAIHPTVSAPNWATMIMGTGPEHHGIWKNGWKPEDLGDTLRCNEKFWPSLFSEIRKQNPKARMVVCHQWLAFGKLVDKKATRRKWFTPSWVLTRHCARARIRMGMPDILFLHFDLCDHAGHKFGHDSPEYNIAVQKADRITGQILKTLFRRKRGKETLVLLTSDHGGIGKGHGGTTREEIEIPWILNGPGIAHKEIFDTIRQYDTAPALLKAAGYLVPECWTGKPPDGLLRESR